MSELVFWKILFKKIEDAVEKYIWVPFSAISTKCFSRPDSSGPQSTREQEMWDSKANSDIQKFLIMEWSESVASYTRQTFSSRSLQPKLSSNLTPRKSTIFLFWVPTHQWVNVELLKNLHSFLVGLNADTTFLFAFDLARFLQISGRTTCFDEWVHLKVFTILVFGDNFESSANKNLFFSGSALLMSLI